MGDAHNLYASLMRIDGDPNLKLSDEVRLAVIININKLQSRVQAYEKVRQIAFRELREAGLNEAGSYTRDEAMFNAEFSLRDVELRQKEHDDFPELKMIKLADLRPTKGEHFIPNKSALRPMIEDWPE